MLNPIFIQIFGREAIDRLTSAGLDTPAAIVRAGAESAAATARIAPDLARRIIAFAADYVPDPSPSRAPRRRSPRRAVRPPAVDAAVGADPDPDPGTLVDEASLVSWMGLARRGGAAMPPAFSVADDILDPIPVAAGPIAAEPAPRLPEAVTLEGTFWRFGQSPGGVKPAVEPAAAPRAAADGMGSKAVPQQNAGRGGSPRRRSGDGH